MRSWRCERVLRLPNSRSPKARPGRMPTAPRERCRDPVPARISGFVVEGSMRSTAIGSRCSRLVRGWEKCSQAFRFPAPTRTGKEIPRGGLLTNPGSIDSRSSWTRTLAQPITAVYPQQRQRVVSAYAFGCWCVCFKTVRPSPKVFKPSAVPDQWIKRARNRACRGRSSEVCLSRPPARHTTPSTTCRSSSPLRTNVSSAARGLPSDDSG